MTEKNTVKPMDSLILTSLYLGLGGFIAGVQIYKEKHR